MPFANLPTHEKDAFFALLDDSSNGASTGNNAAITAAAQRAITKNPAATSRLLVAGINHANNSGSGNSTTAAGNDDRTSAYNPGRVAAAAHAFSGPPKSTSPPGPDANKLVPQKKFGDVDVSSAGAMFRSLRGSTAAKNAPPPTRPSAASNPSVSTSTSASSSAAHVPEPEEDTAQPEWTEEEEAETGEWAEALYDYTSQEASDLHLRAGERVLVTEKTSSDWWTGEVGGRSGLFPALYVKLL
ncbi:hypothetical protein BGY98DRAFT_1090814 [Russula aff. rugulosa BPL654]|nr:hypothetical protein BGY98DRAFT_1090814 [Russula aff. rugulosa BPL654]